MPSCNGYGLLLRMGVSRLQMRYASDGRFRIDWRLRREATGRVRDEKGYKMTYLEKRRLAETFILSCDTHEQWTADDLRQAVTELLRLAEILTDGKVAE